MGLGPGLPGFDAEPMTMQEAIALVEKRRAPQGKDIIFKLPGDGTCELVE